MDIRITDKSGFKSLLKKSKNEQQLHDALSEFQGKDKALPCEYPLFTLKNDLKEKNAIRLELLTGIIYLLFGDQHSDRKFRFKYTLVDIQKVFKHFDKSDLAKNEQYRVLYNELIKKLTNGYDDLQGISINENWELEGEKLEKIEYDANQEPVKTSIDQQSMYDLEIEGVNSAATVYGSNKELDNSSVKSQSNWFILFLKNNKRQIGYLFGFLFAFLPWIVLPIASIGIDRTLRSNLEPKTKRNRIWIYSLMLLFSFLVTIFLNYKAFQELSEPFKNDSTFSESAFDTTMLGKGIVTISNSTQDGWGKTIGVHDNVVGKVGDTITVGILISNVLDVPIQNVKVELSPKGSVNNRKHTFFGSVSGYNVASEFDSAYLVTDGLSSVKYIDSSYVQKNNALSNLIPLNNSEKFSLFSGGISFPELFPGKENYVVITSLFVIEPSQK
jgi:hypothetical protein